MPARLLAPAWATFVAAPTTERIAPETALTALGDSRATPSAMPCIVKPPSSANAFDGDAMPSAFFAAFKASFAAFFTADVSAPTPFEMPFLTPSIMLLPILAASSDAHESAVEIQPLIAVLMSSIMPGSLGTTSVFTQFRNAPAHSSTFAPSTSPALSALARKLSCFASMLPDSRSGTASMSASPATVPSTVTRAWPPCWPRP